MVCTVFIVFPQFRVLVGVGIGVGVAVLVVVGVGVGSSPTSCGHRSAEPQAGSVSLIGRAAVMAAGNIRYRCVITFFAVFSACKPQVRKDARTDQRQHRYRE